MFNLWRLGKKNLEPENPQMFGAITSKNIKEVLGDSKDVIEKDIYTANKHISVKAFGIDGLVNSDVIDGYVLRPMTASRPFEFLDEENEAYKMVKEGILYHFSQGDVKDLNDAIENILLGNTVIVFDNIKKAIYFDAKDIPKRSITEPENESVLKGAKDAFIENTRTNTALIRKKIKSPYLRIEGFTVSKETQTPITIVYLKDITENDLLEKVRGRIKKIDMNSMLSPQSFEVSIKDNKYSIFPEVQYTERVDKFCANLVDGKVGILIDGLPLGYIVPGVFPMFFQASEDYAENYLISSALRIFRYICALISLALPGFYVAVTTFHHEMIPTKLFFSIIDSKEGVPFASSFEIIGLLIAFELLLEASLRLPKTIGATISIIGGLIVGEAAVNAKFISPIVVVIIAITGISGFVIPNQSMSNAVRILRFLIVIIASSAGLFGISFAFLVILFYLCKLESFGVPYLTPFVGNEGKGLFHDTIVRLPRDLGGGKSGE